MSGSMLYLCGANLDAQHLLNAGKGLPARLPVSVLPIDDAVLGGSDQGLGSFIFSMCPSPKFVLNLY